MLFKDKGFTMKTEKQFGIRRHPGKRLTHLFAILVINDWTNNYS
jgi:hypothetical protein